jgi:hypothetical protein
VLRVAATVFLIVKTVIFVFIATNIPEFNVFRSPFKKTNDDRTLCCSKYNTVSSSSLHLILAPGRRQPPHVNKLRNASWFLAIWMHGEGELNEINNPRF